MDKDCFIGHSICVTNPFPKGQINFEFIVNFKNADRIMPGILSGSGIVTGAKKLFQDSGNTVFNGILIVLTVSGETVLQRPEFFPK